MHGKQGADWCFQLTSRFNEEAVLRKSSSYLLNQVVMDEREDTIMTVSLRCGGNMSPIEVRTCFATNRRGTNKSPMLSANSVF